MPKELQRWYDGVTSVTLPCGRIITPTKNTFLKYNACAFEGQTVLAPNGKYIADQYWVGNTALNAVFQALPGTNFVVNGAPVPTDSALASVGAELHMTTRWSALARFDGQFAKGSQSYAGSGTLRYSW